MALKTASSATSAKSDETRARILDTAIQHFREKGFEKATMREIASSAGLATGLAYYYYRTKEDLVLAFYQRSSDQMVPLTEAAVAGRKRLEQILEAIVRVKLEYWQGYRLFLGALLRHAADPSNRLSPFGPESAGIREAEFAHFRRALEESDVKAPKDLQPYLPSLLWLYQMGIILFWIGDRSAGQTLTQDLITKSVPIVAGLLRLAANPLTRPLRRRVVDLLETVYPPPEPGESAP